MPPKEITPIRVAEDGHETHESWLKLVTSKVQSTGTRLFDSEITHRDYISVRIHRCSRRRALNHDYTYADKVIAEFNMSEAQWGAFVSSFGNGGGVPATLTWLDGPVSAAPFESRLDESHKEVRNSGAKAVDQIRAAYAGLKEAFDSGAGKRVMREKIEDVGRTVGQAPLNMEFAAKSLTEHVETVVTKARGDIEAMVVQAQHNGIEIERGDVSNLLGPAPASLHVEEDA